MYTHFHYFSTRALIFFALHHAMIISCATPPSLLSAYEQKIAAETTLENAQRRLFESLSIVRDGLYSYENFNDDQNGMTGVQKSVHSRKLVLKGLLYRKHAIENGAIVPRDELNNDVFLGAYIGYICGTPNKSNLERTTKNHNIRCALRHKALTPDQKISVFNVPGTTTLIHFCHHKAYLMHAPLLLSHGYRLHQKTSTGTPALCLILTTQMHMRTLLMLQSGYPNDEGFFEDVSTIPKDELIKNLNPTDNIPVQALIFHCTNYHAQRANEARTLLRMRRQMVSIDAIKYDRATGVWTVGPSVKQPPLPDELLYDIASFVGTRTEDAMGKIAGYSQKYMAQLKAKRSQAAFTKK